MCPGYAEQTGFMNISGLPRATWGNLLKIGCPEGGKKNQPCSGYVQGRLLPWMPWGIPGHTGASQSSSGQPGNKSKFPDERKSVEEWRQDAQGSVDDWCDQEA